MAAGYSQEWLHGWHKQSGFCSFAGHVYLTYAELLGYVPFGLSPCYKVTLLPDRKRTPYIAPPEKISEMLETLKHRNGLPAKALRLIILTDARMHEIVKARWEDVEWENKILCLMVARYLYLSEEAMEILKELKANAKNDWLFPGRKPNSPLTNIFSYWDKFRKEMGVGQMKIEDLMYNGTITI